MTTPGSQNIPAELRESLAQSFPHLSFDEALQYQESVYQSLKTGGSSTPLPSSSRQGYSVGESSKPSSNDHDMALDEALAISLQELEVEDYELERASHSEIVQVTPSEIRHAEEGPSNTEVVQDDVNPDRMTYEELQDLGESVGSERKGLSKSEILRLPRRQYKEKVGCLGFGNKVIVDVGEQCTICCSEYEHNEYLTTLPCKHRYHTHCIERWLKENRICPVCKREVVLR